MIIYYERYVVIQPGIAVNAEGEPCSENGFSNGRRVSQYYGKSSSGKSISRG
jgi:hypothetical protein